MRRLAIALSIMVMLAMLVPGLRIVAQPTHIPHEYPPKVERALEAPISLLQFYGNVSALTGARQYQDAQTLLEEIKHANIPKELRDIIDLYYSLPAVDHHPK